MANNMISAFPNFLTTDSIFQKMVSMGAPWTQEIGKSMDISFFTIYSGLKLPSVFVSANSTNGSVNSQLISQVLWDLFGVSWKNLWDAYNLEYNPLENYSITENIKRDETNDRSIDKTGSLSSTIDGTVTSTYSDNSTTTLEHGHVVQIDNTGTSKTVESGTSSVEHGQNITTTGEVDSFTYGFNSNEKVPTAVETSTGDEQHSGTDTTTTSGSTDVNTTSDSTQTNSGIDTTKTVSSGESDDATKDVRADTTAEKTDDNAIISETITRNRTGNVGQNSYQELLSQQFELWKWNFFWQVFDDCDRVLCLSVFDPCSVNWTN